MIEPVLHNGDAGTVLMTLPDQCVQTCVTSPPYFGLRDYGVAGQLGLEATPEEFVTTMVDVFREVKRVLRDDGTLWLNIGDSYATGNTSAASNTHPSRRQKGTGVTEGMRPPRPLSAGLKSKDLIGIPWMLAFALRADGWYLRSDIIWHKPNPMPESITDRPTRAHEYLFLLSKSRRYFYDADAIRTPMKGPVTKMPDGWDTGPGAHGAFHRNGREKGAKADKQRGHSRRHAGFNDRWDAMPRAEQQAKGANARTVWSIPPFPFKEAHFATFPPELARRCVLAGSRLGDTVLDPFGGSGTTAAVATELGRNSIYIDLNPAYLELAQARLAPIIAQETLLESLI